MEAYGRGRGRDERERGRGRGRRRGIGNNGGSGRGGRGGGNNQQLQYQHHNQPPPNFNRSNFSQPSQGNLWVSGSNPGRTGSTWRSTTTAQMGRGQAAVGTTLVVEGSSSGSYDAKLHQPSESSADPGGLVSKMQSLKVSEQTSQSSTTGSIMPVRRPDEGGLMKIRTVNLLVNHFPVEFNPETIIRHYDVDVKPEAAPSSGRVAKISKSNLCLIVEKLLSDNPSLFPSEMIGYDGEKNIFSATTLPTGQFKVVFPGEEEKGSRSYIFTVNLVNELRLHKLKNYLTGNLLQIPRDVLQGMDVVMKENPRRHMVRIGRTFHANDPDYDLGYGIAASRGFQHSLKPTSQGLALCLDYSVLAVRKRVAVLDFLMEHVHELTLDNFHRMRRPIESALKGLKVTVIHRRTKQKYVVSGLTDKKARDIFFTMEDPDGMVPAKSVRLVDYFKEKYGCEIRCKDIPCLNLGKGGKANHVPIELCVLVEGQRYPKENLDRNSALILKNMSLAPPQDRKSRICGMLQDEDGPCRGGIIENFEIDVEMNMTRVEGRVIRPPQLKLRALNGNMIAVNVDSEKCQWNLTRNSVVDGKSRALGRVGFQLPRETNRSFKLRSFYSKAC